LDGLAWQDRLGEPIGRGSPPVPRKREKVVAPGYYLRQNAGQRHLEGIGGSLEAREIHDESEIVMLVWSANTVTERRGDVVGRALALPLGVLSGHRGDLAWSGQIRHRGYVAAGPEVGAPGDGQELVHD